MTALYDRIGQAYSSRRRPDPRIHAAICARLQGMSSIVNVGAGTGSYEPADRPVIAIEPSRAMIDQRSNRGNVIQAVAESLPLKDACADAVTAILTIHHWTDWKRGLEECARIARKQVTLLSFDPDFGGFWLVQEYFPDMHELDRQIFPTLEQIASVLGPAEIDMIPVPADCQDGFLGAYWRRPSAYLDPDIRAGISSFGRIVDVEQRLAALVRDLASGRWAKRHRSLQSVSALDTGYRLVTLAIR